MLNQQIFTPATHHAEKWKYFRLLLATMIYFARIHPTLRYATRFHRDRCYSFLKINIIFFAFLRPTRWGAIVRLSCDYTSRGEAIRPTRGGAGGDVAASAHVPRAISVATVRATCPVDIGFSIFINLYSVCVCIDVLISTF